MNKIKSLTVGPIVGHACTDCVRIWGRSTFRTDNSGRPLRSFGIARIRKKTGGTWSSPLFFKMNPNFDMTGIVSFAGLSPDTPYRYQMGCFDSDKDFGDLRSSDPWDWKDAEEGEFKSASDDVDAERQFMFGSCRYLLRLFGGRLFDDRGDKTFRSMLNQIDQGRAIDKLLMVGDQIYADDLNFLSPDEEVDEYFSRYRAVFSQRYIRELMSRVSTYMTLDDHEIENNWPSEAKNEDLMVKYPAAMHAYETYQASHSPLLAFTPEGRPDSAPNRYYYSFVDGCCDFFVTDTRTERDPDDDLNKGEIISESQMADLLAWLEADSGRVKLVVTSVPFFPDTKKANDDRWSGHRLQRDQIIEHIREKEIKRVVFLSGDVHCSMAAELNIGTSEMPLKIYSVVSSAFYWPYPHKKRNDFRLTGHVASAQSEQAYPLGEVSSVFSGDNFSRVRVSRTELEIEVFERKGNLEHSIRYGF